MRLRVLGPALLFLLSTTPAFAEWTWLYPKPQGHSLRDVEFLDESTAIAVGDMGTIMVTHDAGQTWSVDSKMDGITSMLRHIARIDDNAAVAVGDGGVVIKTVDAGASWHQTASATTTPLEDVDFVGSLGIAVGNGVVVRSSDSGESWVQISLGYAYALHGVDVITPLVTVAVGNGYFLRSEDGGLSWTSSPISMPAPLTVAFVDELNGVTSFASAFDFTSDGGQTWERRYGPDFGNHFDVFANEIVLDGIDNLFVAASGGGCDGSLNCASSGLLLRSSDGASSWQYQWGARPLRGLDRNSAGIVLLVGDAGNIYRSSNSGWEYVGGSQYDQMDESAVDFLNPTTGIIVATMYPLFQSNFESVFLRTSDAGEDWTPNTLFGASITDVAYAGGVSSLVYAISLDIASGLSTRLFKSTNGGANWSLLTATPELDAIEFQSATRGLGVGSNGTVAVIENDVVTTTTVASAGNLGDVAFADEFVVVAVGGTGSPSTSTIIRSLNSGETWGLIPHGAGAGLTGVDFASARVGVAVGSGGRILRTGDGGATWDPVASPTTQYLSAVSFADGLYGMAVGNYGTAIETHDGGMTWTRLETPTDVWFTDVECLGISHAILTSWDCIVLQYRLVALPTLISSFDAVSHVFSVDLAWSVRDDADLAEFLIERTDVATGVSRSFRDIPASARSLQDDAVVPESVYDYVLVAIDHDGSETYSAPVRVAVSKSELALLPNVPNPFNPSTTIRYVLPARGKVRVSIYDIAGRLVTTLVDREEAAGPYWVEWNGTGADGARVSSGVYVVRIEAGKQSLSRKMVLLK